MPEKDMADQPVTIEKLVNADKDFQTVEDFIKKPKDETVTTRFGDEIMTLKGLEEEVKKSGGYFKRYTSLAAANADLANIPVDAVVKVTSEADGGDYEKVSAEATSLTKSAFDPVQMSKKYTDQNSAKFSDNVQFQSSELFKDVVPIGQTGNGYTYETVSGFKKIKLSGTTSGATTVYWEYVLEGLVKSLAISILNITATNSNLFCRIRYYDVNNSEIKFDTINPTASSSDNHSIVTNLELPQNTHKIRLTLGITAGVVNTAYFQVNDISLKTVFTPFIDEYIADSIKDVAEKAENSMQIGEINLIDFASKPADSVTSATYTVVDDIVSITNTLSTSGSSNVVWYIDKFAQNFRLSARNITLPNNSIYMRLRTRNASGEVLETFDVNAESIGGGLYKYEKDIALANYSDVKTVSLSFILSGNPGATITFNRHDIVCSDLINKPSTEDYLNIFINDITAPKLKLIEDRVSAIDSSVFDKHVRQGLVINLNDKIFETNAEYNYISWWGSSSIERMHTQLTSMATSLGITNSLNGGKGSETAEQHAARFGAVPAKCVIPDGIITATTAVTIQDFGGSPSALKPYTGKLNGVSGTLSYKQSTEPKFQFVRSSGSDVVVDSAKVYEFIPDFDEKFLCGTVILNVGKNSISAGQSAEYVMQYTDAMYNHLKTYFKRVLLINHYCNNTYTEARRNEIFKYNQLLQEKYSNLVVDNHGYLMSDQVFTDLGITKTTADADAQAIGVIAPSLTSDGIHMKDAVSQKFVENVLKVKLEELWY